MSLSYKQTYPVDGDSITGMTVEGLPGTHRIRVFSPRKGDDSRDKHRSALGMLDHQGMTYFVGQQHDGWGYAEREKPWRVIGDPEPSRRSRAARGRKTFTAAQRAEIDAEVLKVVAEWKSDGASTALLANDLFQNRVFRGEGGWAEAATDWGSRKKESRLTASSLTRLEREGLVTRQDWRYEQRGRYVNPWVTPEFKGVAPRWRKSTGYWPHGED